MSRSTEVVSDCVFSIYEIISHIRENVKDKLPKKKLLKAKLAGAQYSELSRVRRKKKLRLKWPSVFLEAILPFPMGFTGYSRTRCSALRRRRLSAANISSARSGSLLRLRRRKRRNSQ